MDRFLQSVSQAILRGVEHPAVPNTPWPWDSYQDETDRRDKGAKRGPKKEGRAQHGGKRQGCLRNDKVLNILAK